MIAIAKESGFSNKNFIEQHWMIEQSFTENDETNAHQKSDTQEQWTSYKWVPMQDITMCWELKPVTM